MVIYTGVGRVRFKKDFKEEASPELNIENGKCSTAGLWEKCVLNKERTE